MRAASAFHPPLTRVTPTPKTAVPVTAKPALMSRIAYRWRKIAQPDGVLALAELGRETGARC